MKLIWKENILFCIEAGFFIVTCYIMVKDSLNLIYLFCLPGLVFAMFLNRINYKALKRLKQNKEGQEKKENEGG